MDAAKLESLVNEALSDHQKVDIRIEGEEWQRLDGFRFDREVGAFFASKGRKTIIVAPGRLAAVSITRPLEGQRGGVTYDEFD